MFDGPYIISEFYLGIITGKQLKKLRIIFFDHKVMINKEICNTIYGMTKIIVNFFVLI